MSASLVGSEMCIRDRSCVVVCVQRNRRGPYAGGGPGRMIPTQGARGAVSYTHLTLPTICSV
eukprot:3991372-Alexandrium_andersonii.AAC.1